MILSVPEVKAFYALLDGDDLSQELTRHLHGSVVFNQIETGLRAEGQHQVREALAAWKVSFEEIQFMGLQVRAVPGAIQTQPGAARCFRADYAVRAKYRSQFPALDGLEGLAPACGQRVRLLVTEVVWTDANGRIIKFNNSTNLSALKR